MSKKSIETSDLSAFHLPAAAMVRRSLARAHVLGIRIIGHPGSGKTELVEATVKRLPNSKSVAVIVVNPAAERDAQRLAKTCGYVAHVDAAIPTASAIWRVVSEMKLEDFDTLVIEAAGGLAPLHDLGQGVTVAVFSIGGGDDKAAEYRSLLSAASAVVLTKTDLRPHVKFDPQIFRDDLRDINPTAHVLEVSAASGSGIGDWISWLERVRVIKRQNEARGNEAEFAANNFLG